MDHRDRMKHTVEKERSPPDRARMSLKATLFPSPGWTLKGTRVTGNKNKTQRKQVKFFSVQVKQEEAYSYAKEKIKSCSNVEMGSITLKIQQKGTTSALTVLFSFLRIKLKALSHRF